MRLALIAAWPEQAACPCLWQVPEAWQAQVQPVQWWCHPQVLLEQQEQTPPPEQAPALPVRVQQPVPGLGPVRQAVPFACSYSWTARARWTTATTGTARLPLLRPEGLPRSNLLMSFSDRHARWCADHSACCQV